MKRGPFEGRTAPRRAILRKYAKKTSVLRWIKPAALEGLFSKE